MAAAQFLDMLGGGAQIPTTADIGDVGEVRGTGAFSVGQTASGTLDTFSLVIGVTVAALIFVILSATRR